MANKKQKIAFLYLNAYSDVGGIQRFNRNVIQAMEVLTDKEHTCFYYSLNDKTIPESKGFFKSFNGSKLKLVFLLPFYLFRTDVLIIGHVNLLFPLVLFIKVLNPSLKIILITHGIEIWSPLPFFKRIMLSCCNTITAVSNFTKNRIEALYSSKHKIVIFSNCISYDFQLPVIQTVKGSSKSLFTIPQQAKVILTVTRVAATESKKGYDLILEQLPEISKQIPNVYYVLAGKADAAELKRLQHKVDALDLNDKVCITGLITDQDLYELYARADVFILPSQKEGFGIVFLEAMCFGLPVIAGNKDGSVDALMNGLLGTLIDPSSGEAIKDALVACLHNTHDPLKIQEQVVGYYSFEQYVVNLKKILENL